MFDRLFAAGLLALTSCVSVMSTHPMTLVELDIDGAPHVLPGGPSISTSMMSIAATPWTRASASGWKRASISFALALPETEEREHHDHPDFRVDGKVFASLCKDGDWAMLKLTPEAQARCVAKQPDLFEAFAGAWGKQGCTRVRLAKAQEADVAKLVDVAWNRTAPKRLLQGD